MFVVLEYLREISTKFIFNDRKSPTGGKTKRMPVYSQSILATLKATSAYIIFDMLEEKNVNPTTKLVAITPAQEKLLQFISKNNPKSLKKAIRRLKNNVLYVMEEIDEKDRDSCYLMELLEKSIGKITNELKPN